MLHDNVYGGAFEKISVLHDVTIETYFKIIKELIRNFVLVTERKHKIAENVF